MSLLTVCWFVSPDEQQRCPGLFWKSHWCEPLMNGIGKYRWALPCFQGESSSGFPPTSWDTPSLSIPLTPLALVIVLLYVNRLLFSTRSLLLCFFDMSAFFIRLWYPWEQGPRFLTLCIFCIWDTTWNMVGITEGSLIQLIFYNHYMAKHSPSNLVLVEYMLSRHHVCGFSVSGVSETFQGSCKIFKDKNYYSYF